jgi:hypothetical protein
MKYGLYLDETNELVAEFDTEEQAHEWVSHSIGLPTMHLKDHDLLIMKTHVCSKCGNWFTGDKLVVERPRSLYQDEPTYICIDCFKIGNKDKQDDAYNVAFNITMTDSARLLLDEAYQVVYKDRRDQYGAPEDEFVNIGRMWGAILGIPDVPGSTVALMMQALKICRESFNHKHDNLVDMIGYVLCLERIINGQPADY